MQGRNDDKATKCNNAEWLTERRRTLMGENMRWRDANARREPARCSIVKENGTNK
jgi:hypothetical protein